MIPSRILVAMTCLSPALAFAQPALERLERQLQAPPNAANPPVTRESGYLGVVTRNNEAGDGFIRVVEVVPDGPSALAGLREGDLILSVDGRLTRQMNDLATALQGRAPGERVTLAVMRGEEQRTVMVTLGRRAAVTDGPALIAPQAADTTVRRPPTPGEPVELPRPAETPRSDQARIDLLERRVAELERRLAELQRLLDRRP
jgi:membrane-associated protease RseP (regulator of RpoE activity)